MKNSIPLVLLVLFLSVCGVIGGLVGWQFIPERQIFFTDVSGYTWGRRLLDLGMMLLPVAAGIFAGLSVVLKVRLWIEARRSR